jgi:hypothetical protein
MKTFGIIIIMCTYRNIYKPSLHRYIMIKTTTAQNIIDECGELSMEEQTDLNITKICITIQHGRNTK